MKRLICALMATVGLLLLPARLLAVQATLTADAHVSQVQPAVNGGSLSNLNVGGGYTSLLQFDLGVLPVGTTSAQIARATLRLYCNRADITGAVNLQPVYASWTEAGVTYNTLPVLGTTLSSVQVSSAGAFVTLDVTAQLRGWVDAPGSNFGLALSSSTAAVQFDSKENDETGHAAQLEIVLAAGGGTASGPGAAGMTGATGATGAAGAVGAIGAVGPAGPRGLAGATGATGVAGATGPAGPAGAGLVNYRGLFSSATNYANGDVVSFAGSAYLSQVASNHGNTPGIGSMWGLLAGAGATGATGVPGITGATGQQGPPGFGVQGATGSTGGVGATGATGRPGLVYQGAYNSAANYAAGDVVLWNGSSFVSLAGGNHGNTPGMVPGLWGVLTAQGPTGWTGMTGVNGPTGATGMLGPVGPPGERGEQGLQGIAGQAGAQGLPGATGAQGLQGPMGTTGPAGPVGMSFQGAYSSGTSYSLGQGVLWQGAGWVSLRDNNHGNTPDQSPGSWAMFAAAGSSGMTGATGVGTAGATGATGLAGANGQNGATGATGAAGSPGLVYQGAYGSSVNYSMGDVVLWNGSSYASLLSSNRGNTPGAVPSAWGLLTAQGAAGPAGIAGPPGVTGATGSVGPMGSVGAAGPQGAPGQAGSAGAPGAPGQTGATGSAGPVGATGVAGPAGAQGLPGVTGGTGPQGPVGSTGAAGPVGLTFLGNYSSATNYSRGAGVLWQGAGWVSLRDSNLGNTPDTSPSAWAMFATAGAQGATGATGVGQTGAVGATGATGAVGSDGTTGATGGTGAAGIRFQGSYSSTAGYIAGDAVSYRGSTYLSLVDNNHGQSPDVSPSAWALLAVAGTTGATGTTGSAGTAGSTGATGSPGVAGATGTTGATGVQGAVGISFRSAWNQNTRYNTNDAVTFAGSSYLALTQNANQEPDQVPQSWAILAEAGAVGPTGVQGGNGAAASVSVGTVTTLPAGSQATVTNSGTTASAVLNFGIPQGAAGSAGGGSAAGAPRVPAMFHAVSYTYPYYAVNSPTSSGTETGAVLSWMPQSCTASRLDVYSQQSATIKVTLRLGSATALTSTALSCSAAPNTSCVVTGGVPVTAGQFVDLMVTGASGTAANVWIAVECDP